MLTAQRANPKPLNFITEGCTVSPPFARKHNDLPVELQLMLFHIAGHIDINEYIMLQICSFMPDVFNDSLRSTVR